MPCRELRATLDDYRRTLKMNKGAEYVFTELGPVGMVVVEAVVKCLQRLQNRIEAIETQIQKPTAS